MKKKIIEIIADEETGEVEVTALEKTKIAYVIMQVLKDNFYNGDGIEFFED